MTVIEEKLDALMNKIGNQERRMHSAREVGTVERNEQKSSVEEGLAHECKTREIPISGKMVKS